MTTLNSLTSEKTANRINFSKSKNRIEYPDFLEIQLKSFKDFFQLETTADNRTQEGLYKVFSENFPITDSRNNFVLEFLDYFVDPPRYSIEECIERGLTYSVPLKAKLKLYCTDPEHEDFETIVQDVYLGTIPYMTPKGTFVVNGAERVVVSQLHRSPGVFFGQSRHANGTKLYSARVIPFKGSWIEFATDINSVMYAYIDRKKKFPVTTLLRAIGFQTDKDILEIFGLADEVKVSKAGLKKAVGRRLAARVLKSWLEDFVDEDTGEVVSIERNEVILERETILEDEHIDLIVDAGVKSVILHKEDANTNDYAIIYNTLQKDTSNSEKEAVEHIYRQLRNAEPPDEETARGIIDKLFFSDKRYDLGEVGRYRMNRKLRLNINENTKVLTKEDIIQIIKFLIELINAKAIVDDIDHLSNRRVRTVGEQLYSQFGVGLARMARTIRERMNVRDNEVFTPADLINAKTLSSVINSFFGTNQLSQFMDQTNPLAEITHKRRLSALGPGGLSRERAGFEVRDVHYTHYGRLCTIETPEGPNIGLISSLCVYAKINQLGFISTPYRTVKDGKIDIQSAPIYLTAEEEDTKVIAQANADVDEKGIFADKKVKARFEGDFPIVDPKGIHLVDVAPNQIASIAASLIPFLEHDDANRALMGSNMQRQAVPLLITEAPLVATGLEKDVAYNSGMVLKSPLDGYITYVDSDRIIVGHHKLPDIGEGSVLDRARAQSGYRELLLRKFVGLNEHTCQNHRPLIKFGQKVKKGTVLADGAATSHGELALGRNVLVAFMSWDGYNFEDAIIISEKLVHNDTYTSIHIEHFEIEIRETKLGKEEFTRDIPNVSPKALANLDEHGVVRIGTYVQPGDILVGKVSPKSKSELTPEEKLLYAIFGRAGEDVKNDSLEVPSGIEGIVTESKRFCRKSSMTDEERKKLDKESRDEESHYNKMIIEEFRSMLTELGGVLDKNLVKDFAGKSSTDKDEKALLDLAQHFTMDRLDIRSPERKKDCTEVYGRHRERLNTLFDEKDRKLNILKMGDELPPGVQQMVKVYVAAKRQISVGDKMAGRHGNKGVISKILPVEDMPYLADGTPVDILLNPLGVPSRMNVGQILETHLGWAASKLGFKAITPVFDGATEEEIRDVLKECGLPVSGKSYLFDGRTGERFEQAVTVGYIYMLKLHHLVDDKVHARATGPYSLITQQPLGGKARFGGQRFGEMEVWALEAYGAAYILQELLTVKSDDVEGRTKIYESMVKGENTLEAGTPASFDVLTNEIRGLALNMQLEKKRL